MAGKVAFKEIAVEQMIFEIYAQLRTYGAKSAGCAAPGRGFEERKETPKRPCLPKETGPKKNGKSASGFEKGA
jgi:hypothetical protein